MTRSTINLSVPAVIASFIGVLLTGGLIGFRIAVALTVANPSDDAPHIKVIRGRFPKSSTPMRPDQAGDCEAGGGILVASARPHEYLCLVR